MSPEAKPSAINVGRIKAADAEVELEITPTRSNNNSPTRRTRTGRLLVLWGLLAWVGYSLVWLIQQGKPPTAPFLAWHLSGVLPAAALKIISFLRDKSAASEPAETLPQATQVNPGDEQV